MTNEGARKFGKATGENIGRLLAIVLDHRVVSAAARSKRRSTTKDASPARSRREQVADMSLILRTGALPASLTYLQQHVIGPSLGADSIRSGVTASLVGLLLVVGFMLIYYKLSGVNAVIALLFNLVILLGLMAYIGATMTLPGIAGFVLTMGIGVDSNVLIFERIKEELAAQRGVRAGHQCRFLARLPDAARYARRVAHLGRVPVPVRHRPDPRFCDDAGHRSDLEPVHLHVRVQNAVRSGAGSSPDGGAQHLG